MATWLYRNGFGTRALITGASVIAGAEATQVEWDNATNVFDSSRTASEEWWRCLNSYAAAGDTLMFYDEDDGSTIVTHTLETGVTTASTAAGNVTIKSRSGDPDQCAIRCSTAVVLMVHNNSATATNYIYEGLKFSQSAAGPHALANRAYLQASGLTGDITFNNCSIGNIQLNNSAQNLQGLIFTNGEGRTVTYNNSVIENITTGAAWAGGCYWMQCTNGTDTISITGTMAIRDITCNDVVGNGIRGGIYGGSNLSITGAVTINDVALTVPDAGTDFCNAIFSPGNATNTVNVSGSITANDITYTGGNCSCAILATNAPHNINNITANDITITPGSGFSNSVGGVVLLQTADSQGYVRNVNVNNITCYSGAAVYHSNGAGGVIESVIAKNCIVGENGTIYSGGFGDSTIRGCYVENCTSVDPGGAIFGHNHPSSATRAKTVTIENVTITNCTGNTSGSNGIGDGNSIYLNAANTTHTLTVVMKNVVCRGNGTEEVLLTEAAANDMVSATMTSCDIDGGAASINESDLNTAVVKTNITDDGTQFYSDGTLVKDSAYKSGGVFVRYGAKDANGRMLGLPPPIGGFGRASCSADTKNVRS